MRHRRMCATLAVLALTACARSAPRFSLDNARAHVNMLAGTIGSRPIGSPENERARQYIVEQLRLYGFDVRVQEVDARLAEAGATAHVNNIIAVKAGASRDAIGLVSHYDSVPEGPGATDDGFGVAVSLEAARVFGARADRRHSLMVLVTDGEEAGLMGAAGLVTDREVTSRLQAYVNLDSIGSSGPAQLFETGPGNAWIVAPWARAAPHPRGASVAIEIYRRMPNDTDFSILKRQDIPGLNFAPIGDSYAYHTARDTPDRLSPDTLRLSGENVVATLDALDALDLRARTAGEPTFFDVGGAAAFTWGPVRSVGVALLALLTGVLAWAKMTAASIRIEGVWRWLLSFVWAIAGLALVAGAMIGATWALREAREVYHPWYAYPGRFLLFLIATAAVAGWGAMRLGALLPARAHGLRHPAVVWSLTLPAWLALAGVLGWKAPGAAFLWTLPLAFAGVLLLLVRPEADAAIRAVSLIVFGVAGTLWLRATADLALLTVAIFGRLPFITPVPVYAGLLLACGVMVAPPLIAAFVATRPLIRPSIVTAALLVLLVVFAGLSYAAPAYTYAQPLRRFVHVLTEPDAATATWEVASVEPGLDLHEGAPQGWYRASDSPKASIPWGRLRFPFVFRATAPPPGPAPAAITEFTLRPVAAGTELAMTVTPRTPGLAVVFVLPAGVEPARSSLRGIRRGDRWTATYIAPRPDGITWRASFHAGQDAALRKALAVVTARRLTPADAGPPLPAWLPQERAVWTASASWVLAPPANPIAPVPALR
jgi:Peptidase family M28